MFDVSFAELGVVLVVATLILGPEEARGIIVFLRRAGLKLRAWYDSILAEVNEALDGQNDQIEDYIVDIEGNIQRTYNVSKIMPYVKQNTPPRSWVINSGAWQQQHCVSRRMLYYENVFGVPKG